MLPGITEQERSDQSKTPSPLNRPHCSRQDDAHSAHRSAAQAFFGPYSEYHEHEALKRVVCVQSGLCLSRHVPTSAHRSPNGTFQLRSASRRRENQNNVWGSRSHAAISVTASPRA